MNRKLINGLITVLIICLSFILLGEIKRIITGVGGFEFLSGAVFIYGIFELKKMFALRELDEVEK